jgi:hypothetical protein
MLSYAISRVTRKRRHNAARPTAIILRFEVPPPAPRRRRQNNFNFPAKRRREIVLHARHVGATETEDFSRWLIAWIWHNPKAKDQIWSVMEAAKSMGGNVTEAEASAVTEHASIIRKCWSADNLARFLGLTYVQREKLGIKTIGSIDVKKRARKELRKRQDRLTKEAKRRVAGMRPQSESLSATKPWGQLGMSRAAWYRRNKRRNETGETTLSAAIFLSSEDRTVSTGLSERHCRAEEIKIKKELPSSQTATTSAADRYVTAHSSLPLELRLLALGLQSEGPSANVITANDPRMVARMAGAANGGGR